MPPVNNETIVQAPSVPQTPRGVLIDEYFTYYNKTAFTGGDQLVTGPGVVGIVFFIAAVAGVTLALFDNTVNANPQMFQLTIPDTGVYTVPLFLRFTTGLHLQIGGGNVSSLTIGYRQ